MKPILAIAAILWISIPSTIVVTTASADSPSIVGTPQTAAADNTIRVKVGQPPWINLAIKDAPDGAVATWTGPIGEGKVAFYTKDGVGTTTAISGTYTFRCVLQTPKEGLDDIQVLETTVVVEGTSPLPPGPNPPPQPPPPVADFPTKLTAAVKANPEAKLGNVASTYITVADGIKGGVFTTPQQVTAATDGFVGLIGSTAWPGIKTNVVDPHLATLTLAKAGDYEPLWRQIAAAVKAGLTDIPPPPEPDVVPIPVTGLHVLIIEETNDRGTLPTAQSQIFTSTKVLGWLKSNAPEHWRIWDDDLNPASAPAEFREALKLPRTSLPWIVITNGTTGYSGPLPANEADTLSLLERFKL